MTARKTISFRSKVYVWPGEMAAWRFLPMPKKESAVIKKEYACFARGFGSLPVTATINNVSWETSS